MKATKEELKNVLKTHLVNVLENESYFLGRKSYTKSELDIEWTNNYIQMAIERINNNDLNTDVELGDAHIEFSNAMYLLNEIKEQL